MPPRKRKGWLKEITETGITVRVFDWRPGEPIYREVRLDGKRDRKSLGHRDRALAVQQARELAKRLSELRAVAQSHIDGFVAARRTGALGAKKRAAADRAVRDDTIRQNLNWLAPALTWARGFRAHPRLGDVPMFAKTTRPAEPMREMDVSLLLRRTEDRAKLPHLERAAGSTATAGSMQSSGSICPTWMSREALAGATLPR
jgi:hypothetical protein